MKITLLAFAATAAFSISCQAAQPVVIQTAALGGTTYTLLSDSTWNEAEAAAVTIGGHLVTIETLAENTFLFSTFGPTVSSFGTTEVVSMWIGLNDVANEGNFIWSSGLTSSYRNWSQGEPGGTWDDEDYAAILVKNYGTPGQWHDSVADYRLNELRFGIVEISPIPEPMTVSLLLRGLLSIESLARRKKVFTDAARIDA